MSAVATLEAAQAVGVRVGMEGADLVIEADRAPPESLIDALRRDKTEILSLLSESATGEEGTGAETPNRPDLHGLTLDEVQEAAGEDWPMVRDDPDVLEALALAIVNRRLRERGESPSHWTARCECVGCGLVFLWPGSPARVLGCTWCFNRAQERPIPRPVLVTCGTCRHFTRIDYPHLGHCTKGEPEAIAGLWDTDRHACVRWLPSERKPGVGVHE